MTDAGWTAGKDVKEIGWYWWRLHPHRMKVVEVVQDYEGGPLRSYVNGMWIYLEQSGAEWLGPLSPDDKAQGRVEGLREAAIICRERGKPHDIQWWMTASKKEVSAQTAIDCAELIEQAAQDEKEVGDANTKG